MEFLLRKNSQVTLRVTPSHLSGSSSWSSAPLMGERGNNLSRFRFSAFAYGGCWEIDTQEAAVVHQIFAWYTEECWSLKKIATQLNNSGVPVRRKGDRWNAGRISVILDQPAYAGKAYYNLYRTRPETVGRRKKQDRGRLVTPDSVLRPREEWIAVNTPAILSQEVWLRAQEQRMHNKRFTPAQQSQAVLPAARLTGLWCL